MKIIYSDLQIKNKFSNKHSLVTRDIANSHNKIPGQIFEKEVDGIPSSKLLHFDGIEATYLLSMWDFSQINDTINGRPSSTSSSDIAQLISKYDINAEYNAGVILGNKVILRISFISRVGTVAWAIAACLNRYNNLNVTGRFKNTAIWHPAGTIQDLRNSSDSNGFNERVGEINLNESNPTVIVDNGINGWVEDNSINHILLNGNINNLRMSEGYEARITALLPSIEGIVPEGHPAAKGGDGFKALVIIKKLF